MTPAEKRYDELVALVKSHYTPKPSVIVQWFQFHSRTQKPGETVATFVAELRQLSKFCEFGASLEDMLRDRLVCGIASSSIQRRLLAEPELRLQKAQNLAGPSHRERIQEPQRPPRAATAPDDGSKPSDVQTRTAERDASTHRRRKADGNPFTHPVDSKTPFVTRVRSEIVWPECAAQ